MAQAGISTREKILGLIDDIELISREMFENCTAPKHQKMSAADHQQLTELLIKKDADLKAAMKTAEQQQAVQVKMDALKAEVERQDALLSSLQKSLKDAEMRLSSAIYQAKQKMESIELSRSRPVSAEELIRYGHRISSTNAISAPLSWQQGDPRRPYPTDMEMRRGLLGRLVDLPIGGQQLMAMDQQQDSGQQPSLPPPPPPGASAGAGGGQCQWQHTGEVVLSVPGGGSVPVEKPDHKDVEVMSTDSSSSSSSDSQ